MANNTVGHKSMEVGGTSPHAPEKSTNCILEELLSKVKLMVKSLPRPGV